MEPSYIIIMKNIYFILNSTTQKISRLYKSLLCVGGNVGKKKIYDLLYW